MRKYQVISGDGHIEGPIDFKPWLPKDHADQAANLVKGDDGCYRWIWERNGKSGRPHFFSFRRIRTTFRPAGFRYCSAQRLTSAAVTASSAFSYAKKSL